MPKKRTYNFKALQGSSSSSSRPSTSSQDGSPSVNDRLNELRKLETREALHKKKQLAESVNQRSVPPQLHGILGVPESAPPKPKREARMQRERWRTPGPAPPKSWVARGPNSAWAPALALRPRTGLRKPSANVMERNRPKELLRFAKLTGYDSDDGDGRPASLAHLALKTVAEVWDLFDEEDYPALAEIPLRLRSRLLSYLSYYGAPIDLSALRALLQGSDGVHCLDLAGFIGHGHLTLRKIIRTIESEHGRVGEGNGPAVAETWDADEARDGTLYSSLHGGRFAALTHLCLSHPVPRAASWSDLLSLSKVTPQVTHLSLAYWPRPTLTPNLATTTVSNRYGPDIHAGGSHYYSEMDQDMAEPASLLRQLSAHLLCLEWLDLEGCRGWIDALARLASPQSSSVAPQADEDWSSSSSSIPSPFTTTWKNLAHIRTAQPYLPTDSELDELTSNDKFFSSRANQDIRAARKSYTNVRCVPPVWSSLENEPERQRGRVAMWACDEAGIWRALRRVNSVRRQAGMKAIVADTGYGSITINHAIGGS